MPIFAEGDGEPKEEHRLWWAANVDNSKYPSAQPLASIDRCVTSGALQALAPWSVLW